MTWTQQEKVKDELMKEREACYRINKWGNQRRKGEQEGERIDLIGFPPGMLALWRKEAEEEMERLTEMRGGKKWVRRVKHQVKSVFTSTYAEKRKEWSILNTVAQRKSVKFPVSFCLPSLEIEKVCVCVCQYQWVLNLSVHLSHRSRFLIILLW